jgi:hypothetical protein
MRPIQLAVVRTLIKRFSLFTLVALALSVSFGQSTGTGTAMKLDEIGDTIADDEMAYLDRLARSLGQFPDLRGYIIGYGVERMPPGHILKRLYGYRDYLVSKRGIEPDRVVVIAGANKDRASTELWVVPHGSAPPSPISEFKIVPASPLKFDVAYPDCPPEFTIYLYELEDSLKFYAQALRENPSAKGLILVYPGRKGGFGRASSIAKHAKALVRTNYDIGTDRIKAQAVNSSRECTEVELWIAPADTVPPSRAHNKSSHQTRPAEQNHSRATTRR